MADYHPCGSKVEGPGKKNKNYRSSICSRIAEIISKNLPQSLLTLIHF